MKVNIENVLKLCGMLVDTLIMYVIDYLTIDRKARAEFCTGRYYFQTGSKSRVTP